jgi:hypothetical protein
MLSLLIEREKLRQMTIIQLYKVWFTVLGS